MSFTEEFMRGTRRSIPVILSSAPFGVLFGALAVDNGMTAGEAVLMSATVFAGASQMVGLDLFGQHVAPWLIVLSIFAVNFRHVLYSAAVGRRVPHWTSAQRAFGFFFLVDPAYAESEARGERGLPVTFAWFIGMVLPVYVLWVLEAYVGATFGGLIPDTYALGLDFLLPIYFLGLVLSFRMRPMWLAIVVTSAITSIIAYETIGSPWHVSVGAIAGMALAAFMPVRASGGENV
ncbi:AzlC family ABC transporter permease [Aliihoeflea sp. PC F10.4]